MFSVFAYPDINTRGVGEFSTVTRVCITVENSPNPLSAKLFVMALIKREILTSCKVLYTVLVLQKDTIQNTDFSRLNCQLKQRKIDIHYTFLCNNFPSFSRQRNGQIK